MWITSLPFIRTLLKLSLGTVYSRILKKMENQKQKNRMMRSILVLLSVVVLEVSSTEKARPVYINSYDNFQQDVGGEVKVRYIFFF